MTIRYATIWNDQRQRADAPPEEGSSEMKSAEVPMENAPTPTKKRRAAKGTDRKVCSGERLAVLLDTHRWAQRKPKK